MGQNDNADADADADATQNTHQNNSGAGVGVGYSLGELKSSSSMNDFTAILESPQQAISTTSKAAVDTMLLPKDAVVAAVVPSSVPSASSVQVQVQVPVPVQAPQQQVQQQQIAPQQQQVQQQQVQQQQPLAQQTQSTTTTATGSTTTTVGKKRAADAPQSNPCVKKKATGKASSKVGNRGSTTSTAASGSGRRASSSSTKGDGKKNNSTSSGSKSNNNNNNSNSNNNNDISDAAKKATSKDAKGATSNIINNSNSNTTNSNNSSNNNTNKANITDPLTVQAQKALTQKVTAANKNKVQTAPPAPTVAQQPQPAHVPSSYQPGKAQTVVTTSTASTTATTNRASSKVGTTAVSSAASSSSNVKTEESFKGVAQAAVNNLILSAGQNAARYEAGKGDSNNPFSKPVDTSTAHVAALTSNNWVAACAASISDAPPGTAEAAQAAALAAASDPAAAKAARARRATLTADERARQNRDRNREHARNTRLRKKAYVEELKRTLTELVTTRDAAELERRHEKQRELEVREVRYRVMEEFLKLRSKGSEANLLARWVAILEDGFTLTLPRTDYRDMVQNQNGMARQVSRPNGGDSLTDPTVQVLRGATECFDDAAKVAIFLQSLQVSNGNIVQAYNCDRKKFMMDGINAMLEWTFTSTNMVRIWNVLLLYINVFIPGIYLTFRKILV